MNLVKEIYKNNNWYLELLTDRPKNVHKQDIMKFEDLSKYTAEVLGAYHAYKNNNWNKFGSHWGKFAAKITKIYSQ